MSDLKIAWATHEAAEFACKNWHYSKCMPSGKLVKIGAWENGKFIGVVIFSRGASPHLLDKYGLTQYEGCELTRVALTKHEAPVSRVLSIALKFLKKQSPKLRLAVSFAVSFADPEQGHHGGIYQATNWLYTGTSGVTVEYFVRGKWRHVRGAYSLVKGAINQWPKRERAGKHRYIFPLDEKLQEKLLSMSQPYPKSKDLPVKMMSKTRSKTVCAPEAKRAVAPSFHEGKGGSRPTPALQKNKATPLRSELNGKRSRG